MCPWQYVSGFIQGHYRAAVRTMGSRITIRMKDVRELRCAHVTILLRGAQLCKGSLTAGSRNFLSLARVRNFS